MVYAVTWWMVTYLQAQGFTSQMSDMSVTYDMGSLTGTLIFVGIFIMASEIRSTFLLIYYFMAIAMAFMCQFLPKNDKSIFALLFFLGIAIGGPYSLLPLICAADFSKDKEIAERRAGSTLAGIVTGCGNIGATIYLQLIPFWINSYYFLVQGIYAICATIFIIPIFINEIKFLINSKKENNEKAKSEVEKEVH